MVSSPLQRAYDTAKAAADALGLPVPVDDDLTETDFGEWEGLTFPEAAERHPDVHGRWLRDTSLARPAGRASTRSASGCNGSGTGSSPSHGRTRCWWSPT